MSTNKIDNRAIALLGFLAILALIAKPVWDARQQWQFGEGRDDAVYMVTAKSLAAGSGYRQENLPGCPYLNKYPPMFPLFMSIAWRLQPDFPRTLEMASFFEAALLPVSLRLRLASFFLAPALPMAAAWHVWGILHPASAVKTPYIAEFLSMVRGHNLFAHLLEQIAALSASVAESFFPGLIALLFGIPLHHLILIAAVAGIIRLGRKRQWPLLLMFGALYLLMVTLWTFEGLDRLVVPAWPILLAGIAEEAGHFAALAAQSIKQPRFQQVPRMALFFAGLCLVLRTDRVTWTRLASVVADEEAMRQKDVRTYAWIAQHAGKDTAALAWKDCLLYLYTGVPSSHDLFVSEIPESEGILARRYPYASPPPPYKDAMLVLLTSDLGGGAPDASFQVKAASLAGSVLVYNAPGAQIYRFPLPEQPNGRLPPPLSTP
jgi:hypothetical protein